MKNFNGKAIYNPSGKAGEYAAWACNFYVGCSNGCEYCYCKKGILAPVMGQDIPQLKKCFRDESHALEVFEKELKQNLSELQKHGLFFSFTTDPCLPETYFLTLPAMGYCLNNFIPVKILTKCTDWIEDFLDRPHLPQDHKLIAFGFTLTGHDELEPNASTNAERIEAMQQLHKAVFKTFASIEPVIDFESSMKMIEASMNHCDLFKIGLESGRKYDKKEALEFYVRVNLMLSCRSEAKAYWKDSFLKLIGTDRETCNNNFRATVDRDFNLFS